MRCTYQLVSGFVNLRHCPSRLTALRSVLAQERAVYKQLLSKTAVANVRHRVVHQAFLPHQFVTSNSTQTQMIWRETRAHFAIRWARPQTMHRCSQHRWFALQTKRVIRGSCVVRHLLRPPSSLNHAQGHLDRRGFLGMSLCTFVQSDHRFEQRAREKLLSFVSVRPILPQRQITVHPRLGFDIHGTRLAQG